MVTITFKNYDKAVILRATLPNIRQQNFFCLWAVSIHARIKSMFVHKVIPQPRHTFAGLPIHSWAETKREFRLPDNL